ncbi:MAG: DUF4116 domain-containing protein [Treponema sp.]|jgi:predicted methyltransferase|nr:DUF4116 domain-containing protein [Treponema sp.]
MASFDITVDGACKGKAEDIANMKKRLAAILDDPGIIDDPDRLRELFGDELGEICDDVDDEDDQSEVFRGLYYEWYDADADSLQFSGDDDLDDDEPLDKFLVALSNVFPRVEFDYICWYYISWGYYAILFDSDEWKWDEGDGGEEKKDLYVDWRLARRKVWLMDDDAPEAEHLAAHKAADDAETAFFLKLAEPKDEEGEAEPEDDTITDRSANDENFTSRDDWPHGSSMATFELSYRGPAEAVKRMFCDIYGINPDDTDNAQLAKLMEDDVSFPNGFGFEFRKLLSRFHPEFSIQDETKWGAECGTFRIDADWMDGDFGRFLFNGGFYLAPRYPEIEFTLRFIDLQWDAEEVFKYKNGLIVEQYFERGSYTHWAYSVVRYSGAADAVNDMLSHIVKEGEADRYHLMGKHLELYRFYPRKYFDPPCEIMDSRIGDGQFSFYSFNIGWKDKTEQTQTEYLLDHLAAAFPAVGFVVETLQGYNPENDDEGASLLRREYSGGTLLTEERLTGQEHVEPFADAQQYGGGTYYRYRGEGIQVSGAQSGTSYDEWLDAVKRNAWSLYYVPKALRSEEMCLAALASEGIVLRYVPKPLQTERLFLAAVQQKGMVLEYVPEAHKTAEVCMAAVQQEGMVLEYVPEALKTAEVCMVAVKQNGYAIRYVPEALKTAEVCTAAVQKTSEALQYVPEALKTAEVCLAAVQKAGVWVLQSVLQSVPEALKTAEVCLAAVQQSYNALRYVPESQCTEAVCLAAVQQSYNALRYVPESQRTEAVCLAAVQKAGVWKLKSVLQSVPEALKTVEVCMAAVKQDGSVLEYVPEALKTAELCLAAVTAAKQDSEVDGFEYVPEALWEVPEFCIAAVQQDGWALVYVPEELMTADFYLEAVKQNGSVLEYVPEALKTAEVCLAAVQQNGKVLEFVPEELKTAELCLAAVQQNGRALQYVPESLREQVKDAGV